MELTQSLEDYLEAIYVLSAKKKIVRVTDLMDYFSYKVSSVNKAINKLIKTGYVEHEKYGYIELTEKGLQAAKEIYQKHKNIAAFFSEILGVRPDIAARDSCEMEHFISTETYQKLLDFVDFLKFQHPECLQEWKKSKKHEFRRSEQIMKLSDLSAGQQGRVVRIEGPSIVKQRLVTMGIVTGEIVRVERIAPLGDPVEVLVKGYNLSLRKDEAKMIYVEEV